MSTAVDEILAKIKELPDDERLRFDELLAQEEDLEWREESAKARELAQSRGIDQEAIDRAVHAVRYGG